MLYENIVEESSFFNIIFHFTTKLDISTVMNAESFTQKYMVF